MTAALGKDGSARARHRPLRLRRARGTEFQRITVLPLCRGKVTARRRYDLSEISRIDQRRRESDALGHGGTGAVNAQKGKVKIARGKRGGYNLIEQIARNQHIDLFFP